MCLSLIFLTRKTSAKDKEKLLAFITELDEYVAGMESGAPNGVSVKQWF